MQLKQTLGLSARPSVHLVVVCSGWGRGLRLGDYYRPINASISGEIGAVVRGRWSVHGFGCNLRGSTVQSEDDDNSNNKREMIFF